MNENIYPGLMIAALSLVCLGIVLFGLHLGMIKAKWERHYRMKVLPGVVFGMAFWVILVGLLSVNGFFRNFSAMPPRPVLVILLPMPVMIIIMLSRKFSDLLLSIPPHWLIYMQSFRIAVEFLLFAAFLKGVLPVQMTFEGLNFDILTGILALPVGYFCFVKRSVSGKMAVLFNIVGLGFLVIVLIVALLSMPSSFRYFMNEPSTMAVGTFPFIYLPAILVVLAYTLHIFSLRQLYLMKNKKAIS